MSVEKQVTHKNETVEWTSNWTNTEGRTDREGLPTNRSIKIYRKVYDGIDTAFLWDCTHKTGSTI